MNPPLPPGWIILDGYYIAPDIIATQAPDRVVCTNGKTIKGTKQ